MAPATFAPRSKAGRKQPRSHASLVTTLTCLFGMACTSPLVMAETVGQSKVPVAIQQLRRAMLDADVNALTFHTMDQLFDTRVVGRSGEPWILPHHDAPLGFSYRFADQEFAAADVLDRTYTNALLVMKQGVIVYETYRNRTNEQTRFMSWSMAKSITSALVGCALQDGLIKDLDDPITNYLPELAEGAYREVTLRQVLEMRSGVEYEERYDFANPGIAANNHEQAIVQNVVRFADAARNLERAHPPGEEFAYKTIDTAVLGWLLERVTGGSVAAYLSRKIWEPLGAEADGYFIMDGPPGEGREFTGAGFNATLRDYGRFGQMMLDGGQANGNAILSKQWVQESTAPARGYEGPMGGYGYQWWTLPGSNAYMAIGLQGQYIFIDPDTQTVVVKLSYFPPGDEATGAETVPFLLAVSAWEPFPGQ
jgi:CubicO group peptidase (beta-lactamase class C family)